MLYEQTGSLPRNHRTALIEEPARSQLLQTSGEILSTSCVLNPDALGPVLYELWGAEQKQKMIDLIQYLPSCHRNRQQLLKAITDTASGLRFDMGETDTHCRTFVKDGVEATVRGELRIPIGRTFSRDVQLAVDYLTGQAQVDYLQSYVSQVIAFQSLGMILAASVNGVFLRP
jgi:hypothetical protein